MTVLRSYLAVLLAVTVSTSAVAQSQSNGPPREAAPAAPAPAVPAAPQPTEVTPATPAPAPAPSRSEVPEGLVDETWHDPGPPLEPVWQLLLVPERLVEVLFFPFAAVVGAVETYRLDKRIKDALTNEAGTIKVTPKASFGFPDGLGLGANFTFTEFWGGDERWDMSGRYRINGDYDLKTRYRQTFARLEGRLLEVIGLYELDSNEPYYGIGGATEAEDRRVLRTEYLGVDGSLDLNAMGSLLFTGKLLFGFSRQRLAPGNDPPRMPVGEDPSDDVAVPPGFLQTLHYPKIGMELRFDTRDNKGRPTRGTYARLNTSLTSDVDGADVSAVHGELTVNQFIEVLPIYRVLVLTGGVGVARPLEADGEVPYHELVTLGRDSFLRGYRRDRFKARYGWWSSAQYQFPVAEYMNTEVALRAAVFLDIGNVGDEVTALGDEIHYSYGLGLGIAHTSKSVVSMMIAQSPEGIEFYFTGGLEL